MDRPFARKNEAIFAIAALGVVLARLIEWKALGDVPHVMDEVAYAFQARTMAGGHLSMPVALPRAAEHRKPNADRRCPSRRPGKIAERQGRA